MSSLRVCYSVIPAILDFNQLPEDMMLSPEENYWISLFTSIHSVFNVTYMVGHLNEDDGTQNDACLLSLQRNETDLIFMDYSSPIAMDNVDQGPTIMDTTIEMLSIYNQTSHAESGVMESFESFSIDCIASIFVLLFGLLSLLLFALKLNEQKTHRGIQLWIRKRSYLGLLSRVILGNAVNDHSCYHLPTSNNIRIVILVMTVFSALISFYYQSMIKTEMVIVKDPEVIKSYKDLVESKDHSPIFIDYMDSYKDFKSANPDSIKGQVWEKSVRNGLDKSFFKANMEELFVMFEKLLTTKYVNIEFDWLIKCFKYPLFSRMMELISDRKKHSSNNQRGLISRDPQQNSQIRTLVINEQLSQEKREKLYVRTQGAFELMLLPIALDKTSRTLSVMIFKKSSTTDYLAMDEFIADHVKITEPKILTPDMLYYKNLFVLFHFSLFICCYFLVIEKFGKVLKTK